VEAFTLNRTQSTWVVDLGLYPVSLGLAGLTCALLPAYVIRWHVGFYPTTLLEAAIFATIAAYVVESWRLKVWPTLRAPFTIPLAIFVIAGAISVIVAPDRRAALGIYRAYILEPIAFFYVLGNIVRSFRHATVVLAGLGVAGVVVATANAAVILNALRHHTVNPGVTGPVTIFTNANDIALFLVPLIAVSGAMALHERDRVIRAAAAAFLGIAAFATLLSFSRGGYFALGAVVVGLALSHRMRWRLLAAVVVVGLLVALIPPVSRRIAVELDFSNPQNTLVGRFELWRVSLQMLSHHILFGAGLSGFAQTIAPLWNPTHIDRFIYPHNIVLTFWSETGLIGLAGFVALMITAFVQCWRGWRHDSIDWRPLQLGVLLALVAVIAHGLVDVPYFKNDLALEFWALLGLVWAGNRWGRQAAA
jgi:O-antigen ligase